MFRVDIKYCPWASTRNDKSWELLREDIVSEQEALSLAKAIASEHSQCTIRITDDDDAFYETTIES
jgi:hypothetical protein